MTVTKRFDSTLWNFLFTKSTIVTTGIQILVQLQCAIILFLSGAKKYVCY